MRRPPALPIQKAVKVIAMKDSGMTKEDIAKELGIALSTVNDRLSYRKFIEDKKAAGIDVLAQEIERWGPI